MASSGERRMLFDTRGRRRHVIRVVYAVLALLMGASLFLVVGPFNLAELVGNSNSEASEVLDEQAERLERKLAKDPKDEQLLLAVARTRISAGNSHLEVEPESGASVVSAEAASDFQAASIAWRRYLRVAGDDPSPSVAQLVAGTYFQLAESGSSTVEEVSSNVTEAARAQRIVAEQRPSVGSLSNLAIYEFFAGNFAAGDKAVAAAADKATAKTEAEGIEKQLAQYRKRAKKYNEQTEKIAKLQQKSGKEQLKDPFGFGASAGTVGE
jgi:hypothetical protein